MIELHEKMRSCRSCGLHRLRNNVVIGSGWPDSPIVFLGEARVGMKTSRGGFCGSSWSSLEPGAGVVRARSDPGLDNKCCSLSSYQ